jgi:hypothetical protein
MRRDLLKTLVAVLLALSSLRAAAQKSGYNPKPGPDSTVQDVSILQLITNPQTYDGKRVRFIGFLRIEFEGNAIYLHREDFQYAISENAVWIDVPRDMTKQEQQLVNMQYVICAGRFRGSRHGHMGMFSGEVTDVTRLENWEKRREVLPTAPKTPE